jgi:hypothetical protein
MFLLQMAFKVVRAGEGIPAVTFRTHEWPFPVRVVRLHVCLQVGPPVKGATTLIARGFLPDGTREDSSGRRSVGGGVYWKCRGRALKGGGKAMRRNAGAIVRLRLDHVIVLEGGSRRLGKHGTVLGIDIIVFRVADNVAKGKVKERRVVGCRISHERVFRVENVLGEACRVSGFG